jgi:hypothetical protein
LKSYTFFPGKRKEDEEEEGEYNGEESEMYESLYDVISPGANSRHAGKTDENSTQN